MQRTPIKLKYLKAGKRGSSIVETLAGFFILIPVFFLLIDIIALVIAQSVNDDLAKQAARYVASLPAQYNTDGSINTTAMQATAVTKAQWYLEQQTNYAGSGGLICQAALASSAPNGGCTFDPVNGIQVVTQIRCNLPVAVPFGGPSFTIFQAQFTEAPVDVQPTPSSS